MTTYPQQTRLRIVLRWFRIRRARRGRGCAEFIAATPKKLAPARSTPPNLAGATPLTVEPLSVTLAGASVHPTALAISKVTVALVPTTAPLGFVCGDSASGSGGWGGKDVPLSLATIWSSRSALRVSRRKVWSRCELRRIWPRSKSSSRFLRHHPSCDVELR